MRISSIIARIETKAIASYAAAKPVVARTACSARSAASLHVAAAKHAAAQYSAVVKRSL